MKKVCKYCGKEFFPMIRSTKEYCSVECRDKASGRIRYTSGTTGICKVCGKEFAKKYGNERICSDECRQESFKKSKAKYYKKSYIPSEKPIHSICECCGAEANGKKYCSDKCHEKMKWRKEKEREYGSWDSYQKYLSDIQEQKRIAKGKKEKEKESRRKTKVCIVCGKEFTTFNDAQKTCSKECAKRYNYARKQHRIPKEQIVDKDITLEALYRRDSGVCYLCGGKCDWNDRDEEKNICGATYPSIDHIIPVSKGGLHAWNNVRLAHFLCNATKNDTLIEEAEKLIPVNAYEFKRNSKRGNPKQVAQYKDGVLVGVYLSTAEAERKTGLNRKGIQHSARGETKTYKGYVWKYTGEGVPLPVQLGNIRCDS